MLTVYSSIPSNSAYATCDTDWCIIMQNTAGATNDYSQDEAQGAINDLKNGEADGCGSTYYLELLTKFTLTEL